MFFHVFLLLTSLFTIPVHGIEQPKHVSKYYRTGYKMCNALGKRHCKTPIVPIVVKPSIKSQELVYDAEELDDKFWKHVWKFIRKVGPVVAKVAPFVLAEDEQAELAKITFDAEELDDSFWKKLGQWARSAVKIAGKVAEYGGKIFGDDELATLEELSNMSYDAEELDDGFFGKLWKVVKKAAPIIIKVAPLVLAEDEQAELAEMNFDAEDLENGWFKKMFRKITNIGRKVVNIAGKIAEYGGKLLSDDELATLEELNALTYDAEDLEDGLFKRAWSTPRRAHAAMAKYIGDLPQ